MSFLTDHFEIITVTFTEADRLCGKTVQPIRRYRCVLKKGHSGPCKEGVR